ncbi:hypothetical protein AOLI_G00187790 [Acnodon oligacanthus]
MTGSFILVLCCLPLAVMSLTCYTCMFPAISPLDCLKFPQECPAGQRCLSSVATGVRGSISIVLHEKELRGSVSMWSQWRETRRRAELHLPERLL